MLLPVRERHPRRRLRPRRCSPTPPARRWPCPRPPCATTPTAPASWWCGANNRVKRVPVQTGQRGGGLVQLVAGRRPARGSCRTPAAFLLDGDLVRPLEGATSRRPRLAAMSRRHTSTAARRPPAACRSPPGRSATRCRWRCCSSPSSLAGLISYAGLPVKQFPNVDLPGRGGHRHPERRRAGRDGDPDHPAGRGRRRRRSPNVEQHPVHGHPGRLHHHRSSSRWARTCRRRPTRSARIDQIRAEPAARDRRADRPAGGDRRRRRS